MKKKVSWGEAWVVLRPATIEDEIAAQIIHADVMSGYEASAKGLWRQFGQICSVCESSGGLPFKPEAILTANTLVRQAAYQAFVKLPSKVLDRLLAAYNAVNAETNVLIEDVPEEQDQKKA